MRADPLTADVVAAHLRGILRPDQVLIRAAERDAYAHDDAEWAEFHRPLAVVLAESTDEVAAVVRFAARRASQRRRARRRHRPVRRCERRSRTRSCVSLERMTRVLEIDAAERCRRRRGRESSTTTCATAVAAHGLWYPPDPASYRISTIGGNVGDQRRAASAASSTASRATTCSA